MTSEYPDFVFVVYDGDMSDQTYDITVSCEAGTLVGKPVKYIRHDLHTRAVPELVRYSMEGYETIFRENGHDQHDGFGVTEIEDPDGEYVRYDQAAAVIAAKDRRWRQSENDKVGMLEHITDLMAKLAQIEKQEPIRAVKLKDCIEHHNPQYGGGYFLTDDVICELYTAPVASDVDQRAENERLREIVDLFCNAHTDTSGDPNLYILLMETAHDKATALNQSEPRT